MAEASDDRLRLLIERIERLEEEKKGISHDIKDVYLEGKAVGYDTKIMREIIRLRKMQPDDRREMEAILDLYKCAMGLDSSGRRPPDPLPLEEAIAKATDDELAARGLVRVDADERELVAVFRVGDNPDAAIDLYERAVAIVTESRKASISYLQRQLRLGYNTAAGLIERMEKAGIVGAPDHLARREVLAPAQVPA